MSTKKEKCCEKCLSTDSWMKGECFNGDCPCHQSESIEWEESLSEYGQLHSEDCCVNFPEDSRACDVDTGVVDCCENMRVIANFVTAEKEKSRKEENDRWVEMAEAHRPHCSATGNKMLTSMMGKKNRISKAITTAVAKREKELAEKVKNMRCTERKHKTYGEESAETYDEVNLANALIQEVLTLIEGKNL